jgi:acylglycerol lipase
MSVTPVSGSPASAIPLALRGEIGTSRAVDGAPLRYRYWRGDPDSDAAVYLHGIAGHSLWFSAAASRLAQLGLTIYAPDRRGSGLNAELGPGHARHYQAVLRDIGHFVHFAHEHHPGRRVFLVAGCWGAKPGVVFAARRPNLLSGLVLIAPALSVRVTLPPRHLAGVALSLLTNPRRPFEIPLRPEQYTDNPVFRTFISNDPLRLRKATARFYFETARLDWLAARSAERLTLPVLVQAGGHDAIVNSQGLRRWFDHISSPDRTWKLYPEFAHILEFESDRERYLGDLLAWFKARRTGGPG